MLNNMSVRIGGEAGQGMESTAAGFAKALARGGLHVHVLQDFMSRIRGGHNYSQIRVSDKPLYGHSGRIDLLLAFNEEAISLSKNDLAPGATKLVCLNILIGILSEYKAKQSVQLVLDLWRKSGYVVAFTWRRDGAKALADGLFASHAVLDMTAPLVYGPMDGAMKQSDRQKLAQQFAETGGIMVATMGAAGESINELAVAPVGVAVDLHWQPATVIQMVSRLQRMNSPHQSIDMHFVVCKNTLDEQLVAQLVDKIMSASATVPGETAGNYLVDLAPDRSIQPLDIDALFAAFAADIRED